MFKALSNKFANIPSYVVCLLVIINEGGDCLFFTESEISIKLKSGSLRFSTNKPIRIVSALPELNKDETGIINYVIYPSSGRSQNEENGSKCPGLGVRSLKNGNGLIFVKRGSPSIGIDNDDVWDCEYTVLANLAPESHSYKIKQGQDQIPFKSAQLPLNITVINAIEGRTTNESRRTNDVKNDLPTTNKNCSDSQPNEEICFDGLDKLMLQMVENNQRSLLASLGFINRMSLPLCSSQEDEKTVQYSIKGLNSNKKTLMLKESKDDLVKYELWVRSHLDRESLSSYTFTIECTLTTKNHTEILELPGLLNVKDVNDNGPMWSTNETTNNNITDKTIYFAMDQSFADGSQDLRRLQPDGNHIEFCFYDKDSSRVNNYQNYIMNDTKQLIDITSISYDITPGNSTIPASIIVPKAILRKYPINPWHGYYCFLVNFYDHSTSPVTTNKISFTVCLYYKSKITSKLPQPSAKTNQSKAEIKTRSIDVSSLPKAFESTEKQVLCDSKCIMWLTVIFASLIIVGLVSGLFFTRRRRLKIRKNTSHDDIEIINHLRVVNPVPLQAWPANTIVISNEVNYGTNLTAQSGKSSSLEFLNMNEVNSIWILPSFSVTIKSIIGYGNFGKVFHGIYTNPADNQSKTVDVAAKLFKKNAVFTPKESLLLEFDSLKDLNHPHVVKLIGVVLRKSMESSVHDLLVLEYAEFKSLKNFLDKCRLIDINRISPHPRIEDIWLKRFGEAYPKNQEQLNGFSVTTEEVMDFSFQIADGMEYISRMRIVHRDLAARNVLLTSNKICKITDFGLARDVYLDDVYIKLSDETVPAKWLAPECFAVRRYTYKSDVWAFGILLWELITKGGSPYEQEGIDPLCLYQYLIQGGRLSQPSDCSNELYELMKKCWEFEAEKRPCFKELAEALNKFAKKGGDFHEDCDQSGGEISIKNEDIPVNNEEVSGGSAVSNEAARLTSISFGGISLVWNKGYGYDSVDKKKDVHLAKVEDEQDCYSAEGENSDPDTNSTNSQDLETSDVEITLKFIAENQDVVKYENDAIIQVSKAGVSSDEYCKLKPETGMYESIP